MSRLGQTVRVQAGGGDRGAVAKNLAGGTIVGDGFGVPISLALAYTDTDGFLTTGTVRFSGVGCFQNPFSSTHLFTIWAQTWIALSTDGKLATIYWDVDVSMGVPNVAEELHDHNGSLGAQDAQAGTGWSPIRLQAATTIPLLAGQRVGVMLGQNSGSNKSWFGLVASIVDHGPVTVANV